MKTFRFIVATAMTAVAIIVLCGTKIMAQDDIEKADREARKILDDMSDKINVCDNISIEFTMTVDNKRTKQKETHDGTLQIKGNRYTLDINDMVTYADEKTTSVWQKQNKELDISETVPESESGIMTPTKLFVAYKEGYRLRLLNDRTVAGTTCVEIDLYPTKNNESDIVRIRLSIDKKTKQLKQLMQQRKNGDYLTVGIKKMDLKTPIDDKNLVFDPQAHPDVEIVDLR